LLGAVALARGSHAGGLIHNLPVDGSYVVFKAKSEFDLMGNLQSFERELRLASVGQQAIEDEPGRWIEISTEFVGRAVLAKLLIAEKYLKADQNPFEHVAKAYGRAPDGEVRELSDSRLRQIILFALSVPHFDKPEKKEKESLKTALGEFECVHQTGQVEIEGIQDAKAKFEGEFWTSEKVPFGLVKAKVKGDLGIGTVETELEVLKSGTDAKTELPDAK
jgi:hypothetical protein